MFSISVAMDILGSIAKLFHLSSVFPPKYCTGRTLGLLATLIFLAVVVYDVLAMFQGKWWSHTCLCHGPSCIIYGIVYYSV